MNILHRIGACFLAMVFFFTPMAGYGSEEPKSVICSVLETVDCPMGEKCWRGTARDLNFPQFVTIDFEKRLIQGKLQDGKQKTAKISKMTRSDGKIILQGIEERAWNLILTEDSGSFSASAVDDETVLGVFGACISIE